jgi:alpha-L-rhamnosidase
MARCVVRSGSKCLPILALISSFVPAFAAAQSHLEAPISLRCEGLSAPLAITSLHPVLSWQLQAPPSVRGAAQTAAEIVLSISMSEALHHHGTIWASGRNAQTSTFITVPTSLQPSTTYWWSLRTWDENGRPSLWSAPSRFSTASSTWAAPWIAAPFSTEKDGSFLDGSHPMPVFRHTFTLNKRPVEALLSIAGLGQYSASLNNSSIGPTGLMQAWTDYRKTITYDTFDITSQLHPGQNVIRVLLGNGMYNVQHTRGRYTKFEGTFGIPKLTADIQLRYADGHVEHITTNTQWQSAPGPIRFSSVYGGEDFDANKQIIPDPIWTSAIPSSTPGGEMIPAIAVPVTTHQHYAAHRLSNPHTPSDIQTFDIGQNIAGWPSLRIHATPGAVLRIIPGELLKPDGTVSQTSSGSPQWWTYTAQGAASETWHPSFSYYGFRYVQIQWIQGSGTITSLEGVALHSASPSIGTFSSSSRLLNQIHGLILAAMHNNEVSLFTDCPHREKLGWLEETHLVAPSLLFNDDLASLYRATARNIADAQHDDGSVPTIAPQYTRFGPKNAIYDDSPEWGSASILGPWWLYRLTGDRTLLKRQYATMQQYVAYLQSRATDGIVSYGLGDWYDIGPKGPGFSQDTTSGITATLMLVEDSQAMAQIAMLLNKEEDATHYRGIVTQEIQAFQKRFFNSTTNTYDTGSQTSNAMPLSLGIVPSNAQAAVLEHIIADIHQHNDHITTGEVGYPYLVRTLLDHNRSDILLAMLLRTDPPSYGAQIASGATSLTEAWDNDPHSSQDHFMLGAADEWFYRGLAGIDIDFARTNPAERITIHPTVLPGITSAQATYNPATGEIAVKWHTIARQLHTDVTIPAGSIATLKIPSQPDTTITESGVPSNHARGVTTLPSDHDLAIYQLTSGTYHFLSTLPEGH